MPSNSDEVKRYLRVIAGVRLGFGATCLVAPDLAARFVGARTKDDDVRMSIGLVGARAFALGVWSLWVSDSRRQREGVLVNAICEAGDSVMLARELANGRALGPETVNAVVFNLSQHVVWSRSRRLLKISSF